MNSASLPIPTDRIPRRRWLIGALLGVGVLVNYFDRNILAVAVPRIQAEFGFDDLQKGLLLGAFFWPYALLQIPTGLFLDRFGVTRVGRWGAFLWGVISSITACVTGFVSLYTLRALLGVVEAPSFPVNSKATGYWFPKQERGLATAIFDSASKFSTVIGGPIIAFVVIKLGWRWGFGFTALLSLAYFSAFHRLYRDPSSDPRLSPVEYDYIRRGGAAPEGRSQGGARPLLAHLLRSRKIWGLCLGYAAYGYSFNLFITWLPSYVVKTTHMDILQSAKIAAIPWIFATASDLIVGGWLIDHLIKRGGDETKVRKGVLITGMVFGLAVFGATRTASPYVAIAWISIALSGLAATAPVGWSLPALLAPKGGTGTVGGLMNFMNNLTGVLAPAVTGYIVEKTGSFDYAFLVAGVVLLGGIVAFVLLLGRIESIPEPA